MSTDNNTTLPCNPPTICVNLGASLSGIIPITNLPVGTGGDQVAAGNDPRLTNAPRVVPSIDALRALPPPVMGVDSGFVTVQGYYGPGTPGGGEFVFDPTGTTGIKGFQVDSIYQLGSGYESGLTATVAAPNVPGGRQATVSVTQWTSIQQGSYYGGDPTGGVMALNIVDPGSGYTKAPTLTFSQTAPTPFQSAVIHVTGDYDDGGRTIVGAAGVWRRINVSATEIDTDEYGIVYGNVAEADNNTARLNAARDALPVANAGIFNGIVVGQSYCSPALINRQGTLLTHGGNIYVGDQLLVTPDMTISTGSAHTTLTAKGGFAPDAAQPKEMLHLVVNTQYAGNAYPSAPVEEVNATYNFVIDGYLSLVGDYTDQNAGLRGAYLLGAQGCKITQELECDGFAGFGCVTNFSAPRITCRGGLVPLLVIQGAIGNQWTEIGVEHGRPNPGVVDQEGDPYRFLMLDSCNAITIDYLASELAGDGTGSNQLCTIRSCGGTQINSVDNNVLTDLFLIKSNSVVTIRSMVAQGAVPAGLWIDDRVNNIKLPQGTSSYQPNINADKALTQAGNPVLTQVFQQAVQAIPDRFRLRADFYTSNGLVLQSKPYLVNLGDASGNMLQFLVTFTRQFDTNGYSGYPNKATVQVLDGTGLVVSSTTTAATDPATGYPGTHNVFDFAWSKATGIGSTMNVIAVGLTPGNMAFVDPVWTAVPEMDDNIKNGTTPATHNPPLAPDVNGNVAVSGSLTAGGNPVYLSLLQSFNGTGAPNFSGSPTRFVFQGAVSGSYNVTLPAANSYPAGGELRIVDAHGYTSASNRVVYAAASGNTLTGTASLAGAGALLLYSDGVSAWTVH